MLCKAVDELFQKGGDALQPSALKVLENKVRLSTPRVLSMKPDDTLNLKVLIHLHSQLQ